jgi:YfiH family protein
VRGPIDHQGAAAAAGRPARPETQIGIGDAMIANEAGPVLLSLHADCLPIVFVDPGGADRGPAVGVAHAGWRGTVAAVGPATAAAMARAFGTAPGDLHVWLGPSIGGCCYEVGAEVVDAWRAISGDAAGDALRDDGERTIFDLRAANRLLLTRAGVPDVQIDVSDVCTRCAAERWFSHRAQGAATGRFGAIVALRA